MEDKDLIPVEKEEQIEETILTLYDAYNLLKKIIDKYMDMKEEDKTIVALWILAAIFHENFVTFPYLFLNASKESGKSRLLKLISHLLNGICTTNLTEAVLFRQRTPLAIDEFENISSKEKRNLRELLNMAYKKGGVVQRARKLPNEKIVIDTFEVYRPIAMANISGMDDVLEDRCITIILDKSDNRYITDLIEVFENDQDIVKFMEYKKNLEKFSVVSVMTFSKGNIYIYQVWNDILCNLRTLNDTNTLYTLTTLTTQTTLNTLTTRDLFKKAFSLVDWEKYNIEPNESLLNFFLKIWQSEIHGRDLELYFPLFLIAFEIGEDFCSKVIDIAKMKIIEKKEESLIENRDIMFLSFLCQWCKTYPEENWVKVSELARKFKELEQDEWINSKWVGRALKRLGVRKSLRRISRGREVILNSEKIFEKAKKVGIDLDEIQPLEIEESKVIGINPWTGQKAPELSDNYFEE